MDKSKLIYVAGHTGLVGSAIFRHLVKEGYRIITKTRDILDLRKAEDVDSFFSLFKPDYVFLCAAKVGGIQANQEFPADFINDNLKIQLNVINACKHFNVEKLMFLSSSCTYPKFAKSPISENSLLTGLVEPTSQYYAMSKLAGIKMCQAYRKQYGMDIICAIPSNLFGQCDNFNPKESHVIPAFLRKFYEATKNHLREVTCWGSGNPKREFMFVDDAADALVFLMNNYSSEEVINVGTGIDYSIRELAESISQLVEYQGLIRWDTTKPDGMLSRLLDNSKLTDMGWKSKFSLDEGLKLTYNWWLNNEIS